MPANFFKEPEEEKKEEATEEVAKIKVGDEEYDPDELKSLVDMGKFGREVEEKQNTKLDKVYPELTKTSQELKQTRQELEELKNKPAGEMPQREEQEEIDPLEQADKIGILTKKNIDSVFDQKYQQRRAAEKLVEQCSSLEKEIDGKDGRPAFETSSILEHMKNTGIRNPQDAYDLMHKEPLAEWREKQIREAKPDGLVTETASTAGNKQPPKVNVTPQNFDEMIKESLYGPKGN